MSTSNPATQPTPQPIISPTFQPSNKPTLASTVGATVVATVRMNYVPTQQPSLKPRGSFFNNELYVYAAVSLFLIIALICICMVVRQGCLNKMVRKFQPEMRAES